MITLVYFGDRWDSGIFDDVEPVAVDTPVGQRCAFCAHPIETGDRGLMRPVVRDLDGRWQAVPEPAHAECDLRMALGGPAHLQGLCSCHGGPGDPPDEAPDEDFRDQARAVLDIINAVRAEQGRPPMW